jgi:hypothetical protein
VDGGHESAPSLTNGIVAYITALEGGGISFFGGSAVILNSTLAGNEALNDGGCYAPSGSNTICNSSLWKDGSACISGAYVSVTYSDVQGGWPGLGNIDADPEFVDAPNGDDHLRIGPPCIDAGTPDAPMLPGTDGEGDQPIVDGNLDDFAAVDMGPDGLRLEIAARFGTVNAAGGGLANVLRVNEKPGGRRRRVQTLSVTDSLIVTVEAPPAGPDPAPFALYVWLGSNDLSTYTLTPGIRE